MADEPKTPDSKTTTTTAALGPDKVLVVDDASKAELAAAKAKLAEYEKADQERADAKVKREEAEKKRLAEAGEHKALLETTNKELEAAKKKVAELEADAKLGKSARETHQKTVTDGKAKLTDAQKSIVETVEKVDIVQAAALVGEFLGAAKKPPSPIPGGGPPPAPGSTEETVDIAALLKDGAAAGELEAKYPKAYAAYAVGFSNKGKVTSISNWFKKPKTA